MERMGTWITAVGLVVLLSGCGSMRLYNKEADAAATSAKVDYDASKVAEALKGEGAMLDGLEAKEVDAYRKTTQAERNYQLLSLVNDSSNAKPLTTSDGVVSRTNDQIIKRLKVLWNVTTVPSDALEDIRSKRTDLKDAVKAEKEARINLISFNSKFAALPACNQDVSALKDKAKATADNAAALTKDESFVPKNISTSGEWATPISNLGSACDHLLKARTNLDTSLNNLGKGQVGLGFRDLHTLQSAQTKAQDDAKAAAVQMKTAANKLAEAHKAREVLAESEDLTCDDSKPAPEEKSDVDKKRNELCDALKKLSKLGDFGIKLLSEERLAQINTVLAAVSGKESTAGEMSSEMEPSLALLSASSRFGQALQKYKASKSLPALEPLLIERQLTAAQLVYAQGGLNLAKARVGYAQDYADASLLEVELLLKAKFEIAALGTLPEQNTACKNASTVFCASMNQLLTHKAFADTKLGKGELASRRMYRALAFLSESYSVARDRQRTAEIRLIDVDYRDSLLRSEASIAAWNALVSVPIDQLAALHKDGWTSTEIAQLLQSFGVVGVAARIK